MKDKGLNIAIGILMLLVIGIGIYVVFFHNNESSISVKLDKNILKMTVTDKVRLSASIENITLEEILWKSEDDTIASVDSEGLITGNSVGNVVITVYTKDNKYSDKCFVTVENAKEEKIVLNKENIDLKIGDTVKLEASISINDLDIDKLLWASDNSNIASVDSDGRVTGVSEGETIIRVAGKISVSECKVKVTKPEPVIEEVIPTPTPTPTISPKASPTPSATPKPTKLEIHFINAGGYYDDAILLRSDKATIFIDGGRGADAVVKYLNELNVKTIDYVIGSHTEYDHIDAQGAVIRNFNVKHALYANDITKCGCSCDGKDVGNVVSALKSKNMTAEVQQVPSKLVIGDMTLHFIAPFTIGCNKNNNSFIFILQFGSNKFMFTGDADSVFNSPNQLIENAKSAGLSNIEVDMFKYPHHGNQSLADQLFDTMKAKYIVVPNMNASQHPTQYFRNKMSAKGITMYRQSDSKTGNILVVSDGKNLKFTMDIEASTYNK